MSFPFFPSSPMLTYQSSIKCPRRATFPNVPRSSALRNDAITVVHADKSFVLLMRVLRLISGIHPRPMARNREVAPRADGRATKQQTTRQSRNRLKLVPTRPLIPSFVLCPRPDHHQRVPSSLLESARTAMTRFGTRSDTSRENVGDAPNLEPAISTSISIATVRHPIRASHSPTRDPL